MRFLDEFASRIAAPVSEGLQSNESGPQATQHLDGEDASSAEPY
jgi:hypothetical protein